MIEQALKAKLETLPAISGKLKVYPLAAPKGAATPYLVYFRTGTERLSTLTEQGVYKSSFQLSIVHGSYGKMVEIRKAVSDGLAFETGVFTPGTPSVLNLLIENESEFYDPTTKEYVGIIDLQLIYN
jgi:hypothetical protein